MNSLENSEVYSGVTLTLVPLIPWILSRIAGQPACSHPASPYFPPTLNGLAMAVHFTGEVKGDYIMLDGKKFVVCDPTYINAPVGKTMPNMDNSKATIILLE